MKKYIQTLEHLLGDTYKLRILTANNHNFSRPNNGSSTNLRLIRTNNKAELFLHRLNNGMYIAWGHTKPNAQRGKLGTKIRALAVLAALKSGIPMYQYSIGGKNSGSYKIMKKLGANNNTNRGKYHFKFVPGNHNLNKLRSFL
jgi:hypothetical protein